MRACPNRSVTLTELIIAITILGIIVIGISNLELFSHFQVTTAQRRSIVQNDVSYVLEHMSKEIARAIGNEKIQGANTVVNIRETTGNNERDRIKIFIDANNSGLIDSGDYWIAYTFYDSNNQMRYCRQCQNFQCQNCNYSWEILSRRIITTLFSKPQPGTDILNENSVGIQLTACWDPDGIPIACSTSVIPQPDNPSVQMQNNIMLPSVSIN